MNDSEVLELIGAENRDRIVGAYARMTENGASPEELARVMEDMVVASRAGASVDGEALARRSLEELGITYDPRDLRIRERGTTAIREAAERAARERDRIAQAVATVLETDDPEQLAMRLGRLALAESISAARETNSGIMRRTRNVKGWTRQLDSDPCQLCQWWARGGRIWPADHTMPTHPGCACAQAWTVAPSISIRMVGLRAQEESERRAAAGTLAERRTMGEGTWSKRSTRGASG